MSLGRDPNRKPNQTSIKNNLSPKDDRHKLYKPVEDIVKSELFVWDRGKPKAISLPISGHRGMTSIWDNMSERCLDSLDVLDKEIKNYNKLYGDYNLEDSADNVNAFSKGLNDVIIKIQSGVSACVKELREDYIDLSIKFAKPLNESYSSASTSSFKNISYLDRRIVNFVRGHWSVNGKLFQIKTQVLSYSDDEEFRKRVGFMRHDVDLFEVNNLLFCRFCLTTIAKSKEQRDKCELPVMGRCGDLETVIKRYNELAEYQLIKPEEKRVIVKQKLERERDRRELAYRGLTREEQLKRISNGLDEAERKAKKVRKSKGMSF